MISHNHIKTTVSNHIRIVMSNHTKIILFCRMFNHIKIILFLQHAQSHKLNDNGSNVRYRLNCIWILDEDPD